MTNPREEKDLQRLRAVVDAYGGSSARWPEVDRAQLEALLLENAAAQKIVAEATGLDQWLDHAAPPPPSSELMADILFVPPKANWHQVLAELWPFGPIWKPASGLAMALVLSVMTASLMPLPEAEADVMAEIDFEYEVETEILE
jgi:hypothetical protein